MRAQKLDASQIWLLYIAALVCDALVMPFGQTEKFSAWVTTWAVLLDTVLLCALIFLLWNGISALQAGMLWYGTAGAALLFSAACTFLNTERFYRFCSDGALPEVAVIAVLLLVAFYACSCGLHALSRATGLLLWLLAASAALLLLANYGKLQVTNLQPAGQDGENLLRACAAYFHFPAALLLFGILPEKKENPLPVKKMLWGLAGLAAVQIGCAIMSELVLGAGTQQHSQSMYTLARLGGLSVFQRLDPIHLCVWLLATLLKSTILLCSAAQALATWMPALSAKKRQWMLAGLTLTALIAAAAMHTEMQQMTMTILSVAAACILWIQRRTGCKRKKE
ncbi:MAG: GerAB/ArcD/ProY family transporter [Ruthenibacterium sp.]